MYGQLPKVIGQINVDCKELMFYQYLPIKLFDSLEIKLEDRLDPFKMLIGTVFCSFIAEYGLSRYNDSYVYLTAKRQFVSPSCNMNREGWHADGFLTDDINYIWSDCLPTIFNSSEFNLSRDDEFSIHEMGEQAKAEKNVQYPNNTLVRLNQYVVHCTAPIVSPMVRTFVKISFSYDKYNLEGNAHNYLLDYDWEMKPRQYKRNVPQA